MAKSKLIHVEDYRGATVIHSVSINVVLHFNPDEFEAMKGFCETFSGESLPHVITMATRFGLPRLIDSFMTIKPKELAKYRALLGKPAAKKED